MNKRLALATAAVASLVSILAFQNCSMRKFDSASLNSTVQTSASTRTPASTPTTAGNQTPAPSPAPGAVGTSPNPTPTPTPPPATTPASCLIHPNTQGTVMGISGQPAIASSYALVTRSPSYGPYSPASSSVFLSASSVCLSENQFTNPGKCQTGSNTTCQKSSTFSINISIKCDSESDTANACTNFANYFDTDIALDDANLGRLISISASYNTNTCDTTGASSTNYLGGYYPNSPQGKVRISAIQNLSGGQVITVKLIGVQLLVGNDPNKGITLDGTYAGKIITQNSCTP